MAFDACVDLSCTISFSSLACGINVWRNSSQGKAAVELTKLFEIQSQSSEIALEREILGSYGVDLLGGLEWSLGHSSPHWQKKAQTGEQRNLPINNLSAWQVRLHSRRKQLLISIETSNIVICLCFLYQENPRRITLLNTPSPPGPRAKFACWKLTKMCFASDSTFKVQILMDGSQIGTTPNVFSQKKGCMILSI